MKATWITKEMNQYANRLSRMTDTDDWSIDQETYAFLCQELSQPTFDRFADDQNCKTPKFNLQYLCPNTARIEAFAQDWSELPLNWLCPPIKYIPTALRHARMGKAWAILVIPQWPSNHFWTLLHNGRDFKHFINGFRVIQPFYTSTAQTSGFTQFNSIAFLINYT